MPTNRRDGPTDAKVIESTGKSREHWFRVLDKFGCKEKGHTASARHLEKEHGLTVWWSQTITVDYERARGIREVGQRSSGKFAFDVTRTINAPVEEVWNAWADAKTLSKWFTTNHKHEFVEGGSYENSDGDKGTIKKIVRHQRIHLTWDNEKHCPGSLVMVQFAEKGPDKTTVAITHEKLPDKKGVEEMREGWTWALESLKSFCETGKPIKHEDWLAARK